MKPKVSDKKKICFSDLLSIKNCFTQTSLICFARNLTLLVRGGGTLCPPLRNIALIQVIWGPGPPKHIDFSEICMKNDILTYLGSYHHFFTRNSMGRVFGFLEVNSVGKNEKYIWISKFLKFLDFWILDSAWSLTHDCTFLVMESLRHNPCEVTHKISAHLGH